MKRRLLSLPLLFLSALSVNGESGGATPHWVKEARQMKPAEIPAGDYGYLSEWIAKNARSADEYLLAQFERHDVVIFGEYHDVKEHKDFISNLMPRLYHEAGVRCIGWEFSNPSEDADLERLVSMPDPGPEAVLKFARRHMAAWNSKEHWDLIEAIRKLNASLPKDQPKMRLVGIDIPVDWHDLYTKIKTTPRDSAEGKEVQRWYCTRDVIMAENAERETLAKGLKGLLFVGRGHDETHLGAAPDRPLKRPIMAKVLRDKYGDRVFQVAADGGRYPVVQRAMKPLEHMVIGFDMYSSPFASILSDDITPERPMASLVRGYIYFGSCQQLHSNTPIKGFVTDEMYRKHRTYYEVDFGVKFDTAREVDEYLQQRNWKIRCPAAL